MIDRLDKILTDYYRQQMKTFRFETKVARGPGGASVLTPFEFVDWYHADSEEEARKLWDEDLHRYGIPLEDTSVSVREATAKELEII